MNSPMKNQKRVVIADDHGMLRKHLSSLLSSHPDFHVIGEAEDGLEAIERVEELAPDLVVLDIAMPRMNGIEATKEIKRRHPEMKILVITVHDDEQYMNTAMEAGADGYFLKDATYGELMIALHDLFAEKKKR